MSLTCLSCKLLFSIPKLHQEHYKTDWHRYNLKRKLAELPPLTRDEFDKRSSTFENVDGKDKKLPLCCDVCNKYFSSLNAMNNHLKSRKHLDAHISKSSKSNKSELHHTPAKKSAVTVPDVEEDDECSNDDDGEWESCDESDEEENRVIVDTNDCLFCDHQSESTEGNVSHMTEAHSFFIPDIQYLTDLDGLIASLAAKIVIGHLCLWCDGKGKGFNSVKSVKQHMIDKGHCKMLHEGEALFYYADFYDYSAIDESGESSDTNVIESLLEDSDYELVLPSGATIGHRSLAVYYKQNLKPVSSDNKQKVIKVLQQYKELGYTGVSGPAALKVARDISYVQKIKQRYSLKLSLKKNKLQPHFRRQVMF